MGAIGALLAPVVGGLALGVAFNPAASLVGAPIAAALAGSPRAANGRFAWAAAAAVAAWLLGDGFRVMARLQDTLAGRPVAGPSSGLVLLAAWALAGLALGYLLPAALGAYVGRQVVRGTGWLSAAFVAGLASTALASLASPAAGSLLRLVAR